MHYRRGANEAERVDAEMRNGGGRADAIAADLATDDGPHKLAKLVRDVVGDRLDILVANHRRYHFEDFDKLFAVNVPAPYFLLQQLLSISSKGSSVVLVSSLAARAGVLMIPAYAATKRAVVYGPRLIVLSA